MNSNNLFEIALVYKIDDNDDYKIELVHAEKSGQHYRLKGVPMFAENVAFDDIVAAEFEDGFLFFEELIKPSEHSVVQMVFFKEELFHEVSDKLLAFNINLYRLDDKYYLALDIPASINYAIVREYLVEQRRSGYVDFKEACLSNTHSEQLSSVSPDL